MTVWLRTGLLAAVTFALALQGAAAETLLQDLKADTERLAAPITGSMDMRLRDVAHFDHQVTGVTVTEAGRIFVSFPRWSEDVPVSVAEVMSDGTVKPYPDAEWNAWRNFRTDVTPGDHFVCVQSVVADGHGSLFALDPAAPDIDRTVAGGPKLVRIDLASNTVKRTYLFDQSIAGPASYLNDVRISPDDRFAYITDSGMPGGLVVVDLGSGEAWRVLSGDRSTQFDKDVLVMTDGTPLRRPDDRAVMISADGIALSPDGAWLYFQALTSRSLYRIPTSVLQDARTHPDAAGGKLAGQLERVATTEPVDGLWIDHAGRLYLTSIGSNAVKTLSAHGSVEMLLQDSRLRWPDTFSQGPDGTLYVTASHIQDSPWFHPSGWRDHDFALYKFAPPQDDFSSSAASAKPKDDAHTVTSGTAPH